MLFRVLHSEFCDLIVRRSIESAEKVVIIKKQLVNCSLNTEC